MLKTALATESYSTASVIIDSYRQAAAIAQTSGPLRELGVISPQIDQDMIDIRTHLEELVIGGRYLITVNRQNTASTDFNKPVIQRFTRVAPYGPSPISPDLRSVPRQDTLYKPIKDLGDATPQRIKGKVVAVEPESDYLILKPRWPLTSITDRFWVRVFGDKPALDSPLIDVEAL